MRMRSTTSDSTPTFLCLQTSEGDLSPSQRACFERMIQVANTGDPPFGMVPSRTGERQRSRAREPRARGTLGKTLNLLRAARSITSRCEQRSVFLPGLLVKRYRHHLGKHRSRTLADASARTVHDRYKKDSPQFLPTTGHWDPAAGRPRASTWGSCHHSSPPIA